MADRFVLDEKTGIVLVFPDLLQLSMSPDDIDGDEITITLDAELRANPKVLQQFPKSRQIVIADPFFVLRKPLDSSVLAFQYVPTEPLAGRAVLVVKKSDIGRVKLRVTTDPTFFDPEYSGRSESYVGTVEIASATLTELDVEKVRATIGLAAQIVFLEKLVREHLPNADSELSATLIDKLISDEGQVSKMASHWQLVMKPGSKVFRLTEVKEVTKRVFGNVEHISL